MKLPISFLGSCLLASSFSPAFAEEITGRFDLTYTHAYALGLIGAPRYEQYDNVCKELAASLLNTNASVDYTINTTNDIETVYYDYLGSRLPLHPMGLTDLYAFSGSAGVVAELAMFDVRNVFFKMNKEFKNPNSAFNFVFPTEGRPEYAHGFQCVVSTSLPY